MSVVDRIEVYKAEDGWRWRAVSDNGETLYTGEAYQRRIDLLRVVSDRHEGVMIVELDTEAEDVSEPNEG